ncbi:alpha/beta hydrolase [Gracilibacillus timonensis]|uniref:alpha/beta hydrolase n=1 Tax=Gracilibacillus timonensis TaxID=1816696 RepID=UPI00082553BC|nr:alpha/beta hydrolase [Gracilibacillus timonensis]
MSIQEYKNVAYGPHGRNKLDAYIVKNETVPSPLVIFFHGGGYVGGEKEGAATELMHDCLAAGISFVTCNYRFITTDPYPAPMQDGTRAIQFVRSMAKEWGFDGQRIASAGSSAGGHIALWNALNGDLADPASPDPIERIPSDVTAFVGHATQVSKDQRFYEPIYTGPHIQPNLTLFYGISSLDELDRPDIIRLAEEASAITYMSEHAPPAFMSYDFPLEGTTIPADASVDKVIHHPMHGYLLKQKYDQLGIPFTLRHAGDPVQKGEITRFLLEQYGEK